MIPIWITLLLYNIVWFCFRAFLSEVRIIVGACYFGTLIVSFVFRKKLGPCFGTINFILSICFFSATLFFRKNDSDTGKVQLSFDTIFYVGFNFGQLQRLMQAQISRLSYVLVYELVFTIPKVLILSDIPVDSFILHLFFVISVIVLKYIEDKGERKLFSQWYTSREGLTKFRELIDKYLPQSIIIYDHLMENTLFSNAAFKKNFKREQDIDDIKFMEEFKCAPTTCSTDMTKATSINVGDNSHNDLKALLLEKNYDKPSIICSYTDAENNRKVFNATAFPFVWDGAPAVTVILNDITHEESVFALRLADANKDKALSTVSHELRTPISGILGMLQVMEKQTTDPSFLNSLMICKSNSSLLLNIVNSILDLQQIRANKLKIHKQTINLHQTMEEIITLFKFPASQKSIELKLDIDPSLPKYFHTDKSRLSQILIHLTANALKFTFKGSIKLGGKADETDKGRIWLWVEDSGIGIKDEDKKKLFQMFGKLEDSQHVNTQGVGLGLTISNTLVKMLNKNEEEGIEVESEYGKGSKFLFSLISEEISSLNMRSPGFNSPSVPSESLMARGVLTKSFLKPLFRNIMAQHKSNPTSPEQDSPITKKTKSLRMSLTPSLTPKTNPRKQNYLKLQDLAQLEQIEATVLLVDDNPFNFIYPKSLIEEKGFKVVTAYNGKEAIEIFENNRTIKLILMDCQMPVMDGFEATTILKDRMKKGELPNIPIYALSANEIEQDRERFVSSGMDGYIRKPLNEAEIENVFKKHGFYKKY